MKKGLVLVLAVLISVSIFADDKELGYRAAGLSNSILYPEGDFYSFPSRLTTLDQGLLQINPELNLSNLGRNEQTRPTGHANEGGTYTSSDAESAFGIDGMFFTPISDTFNLGFILDTYLDFNSTQDTEDNGYTTVGETVTLIQKDYDFTLTPTVLAAFKLGNLDAGARVVSYNLIDTVDEEFLQTTNSALNNGNMYYSTGATEASVNSHYIGGTFSVGSTSESLEWGASLMGGYFVVNTVNYRAVDSDLDGFGDTIMTENDYQIAPAAQGGNGAAYYDELDKLTSYSLGVEGFAKLSLDNDKSLILGLNWMPLSNQDSTTYARGAAGDLDEYVETVSDGLINFNVDVALDMPISRRASFRIGTGVDFERTVNSVTDLDALGVTTFDPLNTNNYVEMNYATDPANGDVIADHEADGRPDAANNEFDFTMPLRASFRFKPAETVTLFSSLSGNIVYSKDTYNIFNTNDNTVWTEETSFFGFDISSVALFTGIEFMFNENATLLMGTSIYPFNTNVDITGDPLPNLDGTDTTDATTSTVSDTEFDMNLDITVTFRY